jgi:hypothetical protein
MQWGIVVMDAKSRSQYALHEFIVLGTRGTTTATTQQSTPEEA